MLSKAANNGIYQKNAANDSAAKLTKQADGYNHILESEEALKCSNQAIAGAPLFAPAYFARAEARCALGQVTEALSDLSTAAKQKPFWAAALRERSSIYFALGKYDAALADANAIMTSNSTDGTRCLRAKIYTAMHKPELAVTDLSLALKIKPHDYDILCLRAKAYAQAKQFENALADYNELAALDEKSNIGHEGLANASIYAERADVYKHLGKLRLAAADEAKAKSTATNAFSNAPFRLKRGTK